MTKHNQRFRRGRRFKATHRSTDNGRPRIVVHRSLDHIYVQLVDHIPGKGDLVLASASTLDKELRPSLSGTKVEKAYQVGKLLGTRAKAKGIVDVAFDRAGYKYHGRIKALADGAREEGLNF